MGRPDIDKLGQTCRCSGECLHSSLKTVALIQWIHTLEADNAELTRLLKKSSEESIEIAALLERMRTKAKEKGEGRPITDMWFEDTELGKKAKGYSCDPKDALQFEEIIAKRYGLTIEEVKKFKDECQTEG